MQPKRRIVHALGCTFILIAGHALAHDLTPPPWRGESGSTFQHWQFNAPGGGLPDSGVHNPYGPPSFNPNPNATWDATDPSGQLNGVYFILFDWDLSFSIPNHGAAGRQKELWLQFTYITSDGIGPASSVFPATGSATLQSISAIDLGGGVYHELHIYSLSECPQWETVSLRPGSVGSPSWVDQVVIDTRCVIPTPGTLLPLMLAGLASARRRR